MPMSLSALPLLPPGTIKIIIFDTNAYRELTFGLSLDKVRSNTLQLRHLEQNNHIFALANPIVIWELIGHLGDTSDPAYNYCLNALVALAEHTWSPFNVSDGVCLFSDAESTVCRELFNAVPPTAAQNVQNLSKLAAHVKKYAPSITDDAVINNLKVFSAEMRKMESQWLTDMQKVLNDCDPNMVKTWVGGTGSKDTQKKLRAYFGSDAFMKAWAAITVMRYASMVDAKLTQKDLAEKAKTVQEVFPVPFHLISALLQKFSTSKPMKLDSPKKKRGNFMWDAAICFSIGGLHEIDGAPMFLVTGDNAIRDAAKVANCSNRVLSLSDYLKNVGFVH